MKFGDGIDWDNEARRAEAATAGAYATEALRAGASDLVSRLLDLKAGKRLIDCGCNIASYYPPLQGAGFDYVGVDQSAEALNIARKRYPGIELVHSYLWDMNFVAKPFDIAISMAVLQHNQLLEKRSILRAVAQAVRPAGYFAMQESTVLKETATQLRQAQWIELVEGHGFKLVDTWHPNPEYAVNDAYLFERLP